MDIREFFQNFGKAVDKGPNVENRTQYSPFELMRSDSSGVTPEQVRARDITNAEQRRKERLGAIVRDIDYASPYTGPQSEQANNLSEEDRLNAYLQGNYDPELQRDLDKMPSEYLEGKYGRVIANYADQKRMQNISNFQALGSYVSNSAQDGAISYTTKGLLGGVVKGVNHLSDTIGNIYTLATEEGQEEIDSLRKRAEATDRFNKRIARWQGGAYDHGENRQGLLRDFAEQYRQDSFRKYAAETGNLEVAREQSNQDAANYYDAISVITQETLINGVGEQAPQLVLALVSGGLGSAAAKGLSATVSKALGTALTSERTLAAIAQLGSMAGVGLEAGLQDGISAVSEAKQGVYNYFDNMTKEQRQAFFSNPNPTLKKLMEEHPNATEDELIQMMADSAGLQAGLVSGVYTGISAGAASPFLSSLSHRLGAGLSPASRNALSMADPIAEGITEYGEELVQGKAIGGAVKAATGDNNASQEDLYAEVAAKQAGAIGAVAGGGPAVVGAARLAGNVVGVGVNKGISKVTERAEKKREAAQSALNKGDGSVLQKIKNEFTANGTKESKLFSNLDRTIKAGRQIDENLSEEEKKAKREADVTDQEYGDYIRNLNNTVQKISKASQKLQEKITSLQEKEKAGNLSEKEKGDLVEAQEQLENNSKTLDAIKETKAKLVEALNEDIAAYHNDFLSLYNEDALLEKDFEAFNNDNDVKLVKQLEKLQEERHKLTNTESLTQDEQINLQNLDNQITQLNQQISDNGINVEHIKLRELNLNKRETELQNKIQQDENPQKIGFLAELMHSNLGKELFYDTDIAPENQEQQEAREKQEQEEQKEINDIVNNVTEQAKDEVKKGANTPNDSLSSMVLFQKQQDIIKDQVKNKKLSVEQAKKALMEIIRTQATNYNSLLSSGKRIKKERLKDIANSLVQSLDNLAKVSGNKTSTNPLLDNLSKKLNDIVNRDNTSTKELKTLLGKYFLQDMSRLGSVKNGHARSLFQYLEDIGKANTSREKAELLADLRHFLATQYAKLRAVRDYRRNERYGQPLRYRMSNKEIMDQSGQKAVSFKNPEALARYEQSLMSDIKEFTDIAHAFLNQNAKYGGNKSTKYEQDITTGSDFLNNRNKTTEPEKDSVNNTETVSEEVNKEPTEKTESVKKPEPITEETSVEENQTTSKDDTSTQNNSVEPEIKEEQNQEPKTDKEEKVEKTTKQTKQTEEIIEDSVKEETTLTQEEKPSTEPTNEPSVVDKVIINPTNENKPSTNRERGKLSEEFVQDFIIADNVLPSRKPEEETERDNSISNRLGAIISNGLANQEALNRLGINPKENLLAKYAKYVPTQEMKEEDKQKYLEERAENIKSLFELNESNLSTADLLKVQEESKLVSKALKALNPYLTNDEINKLLSNTKAQDQKYTTFQETVTTLKAYSKLFSSISDYFIYNKPQIIVDNKGNKNDSSNSYLYNSFINFYDNEGKLSIEVPLAMTKTIMNYLQQNVSNNNTNTKETKNYFREAVYQQNNIYTPNNDNSYVIAGAIEKGIGTRGGKPTGTFFNPIDTYVGNSVNEVIRTLGSNIVQNLELNTSDMPMIMENAFIQGVGVEVLNFMRNAHIVDIANIHVLPLSKFNRLVQNNATTLPLDDIRTTKDPYPSKRIGQYVMIAGSTEIDLGISPEVNQAIRHAVSESNKVLFSKTSKVTEQNYINNVNVIEAFDNENTHITRTKPSDKKSPITGKSISAINTIPRSRYIAKTEANKEIQKGLVKPQYVIASSPSDVVNKSRIGVNKRKNPQLEMFVIQQSSIPFDLNQEMFAFLDNHDENTLKHMFGWRDPNTAHLEETKESIKSRNSEIERQLEFIFQTARELEQAKKTDPNARVYFSNQVTENMRIMQLGGTNPQSQKIIRELFIPTQMTEEVQEAFVETLKKNKVHMPSYLVEALKDFNSENKVGKQSIQGISNKIKGDKLDYILNNILGKNDSNKSDTIKERNKQLYTMMLLVGQGLGIKVEKKAKKDIINDLKNIFNKDHYFRQIVDILSNNERYNNEKDVLENLIIKLSEDFDTDTPRALNSLLTLSNYLMKHDRQSYTPLFQGEADGISNGMYNLLRQFYAEGLNPDNLYFYFSELTRFGDASMFNILNQDMLDAYEGSSTIFSNGLPDFYQLIAQNLTDTIDSTLLKFDPAFVEASFTRTNNKEGKTGTDLFNSRMRDVLNIMQDFANNAENISSDYLIDRDVSIPNTTLSVGTIKARNLKNFKQAALDFKNLLSKKNSINDVTVGEILSSPLFNAIDFYSTTLVPTENSFISVPDPTTIGAQFEAAKAIQAIVLAYLAYGTNLRKFDILEENISQEKALTELNTFLNLNLGSLQEAVTQGNNSVLLTRTAFAANRALAKLGAVPATYGAGANGITNQVETEFKKSIREIAENYLNYLDKYNDYDANKDFNQEEINLLITVHNAMFPTQRVDFNANSVDYLYSDSYVEPVKKHLQKVVKNLSNSYLVPQSIKQTLGQMLSSVINDAHSDVFKTANEINKLNDANAETFSFEVLHASLDVTKHKFNKALEEAKTSLINERKKNNEPTQLTEEDISNLTNEVLTSGKYDLDITNKEMNKIIKTVTSQLGSLTAFSMDDQRISNIIRSANEIAAQRTIEVNNKMYIGPTITGKTITEGMYNPKLDYVYYSTFSNALKQIIKMYQSGGATNLTNTVVSVEGLTQAGITAYLLSNLGIAQTNVFDGVNAGFHLTQLAGDLANYLTDTIHNNTNLAKFAFYRATQTDLANIIRDNKNVGEILSKIQSIRLRTDGYGDFTKSSKQNTYKILSSVKFNSNDLVVLRVTNALAVDGKERKPFDAFLDKLSDTLAEKTFEDRQQNKDGVTTVSLLELVGESVNEANIGVSFYYTNPYLKALKDVTEVLKEKVVEKSKPESYNDLIKSVYKGYLQDLKQKAINIEQRHVIEKKLFKVINQFGGTTNGYVVNQEVLDEYKQYREETIGKYVFSRDKLSVSLFDFINKKYSKELDNAARGINNSLVLPTVSPSATSRINVDIARIKQENKLQEKEGLGADKNTIKANDFLNNLKDQINGDNFKWKDNSLTGKIIRTVIVLANNNKYLQDTYVTTDYDVFKKYQSELTPDVLPESMNNTRGITSSDNKLIYIDLNNNASKENYASMYDNVINTLVHEVIHATFATALNDYLTGRHDRAVDHLVKNLREFSKELLSNPTNRAEVDAYYQQLINSTPTDTGSSLVNNVQDIVNGNTSLSSLGVRLATAIEMAFANQSVLEANKDGKKPTQQEILSDPVLQARYLAIQEMLAYALTTDNLIQKLQRTDAAKVNIKEKGKYRKESFLHRLLYKIKRAVLSIFFKEPLVETNYANSNEFQNTSMYNSMLFEVLGLYGTSIESDAFERATIFNPFRRNAKTSPTVDQVTPTNDPVNNNSLGQDFILYQTTSTDEQERRAKHYDKLKRISVSMKSLIDNINRDGSLKLQLLENNKKIKNDPIIPNLRDTGIIVTPEEANAYESLRNIYSIVFKERPELHIEADKWVSKLIKQLANNKDTSFNTKQLEAIFAEPDIASVVAAFTTISDLNEIGKTIDKQSNKKSTIDKFVKFIDDVTVFRDVGAKNEQTLSKIVEATAKLDNLIKSSEMQALENRRKQIEIAEKRQQLLDRVENITSSSIPPYLAQIVNTAMRDWALSGMLTGKDVDSNLGKLIQSVIENITAEKGRHTWLSGFLRWVAQARADTQYIYAMKNQTAATIEHIRENTRQAIPTAIIAAFNNEKDEQVFNEEIDKIIAKSILPTKLNNLVSNKKQVLELTKLLGSKKELNDEIDSVQARLLEQLNEQFSPKEASQVLNWINWQTQGLGELMITGKAKANRNSHFILPNSRAIASLANLPLNITRNTASLEANVKSYKELVGKLTTLHAIANLTDKDRSDLKKLITEHPDGVTATIYGMNNIDNLYDSRGFSLHGKEGYNHAKSDPFASIKLVTKDSPEYLQLSKMGYEYQGIVEGTNLYIMYNSFANEDRYKTGSFGLAGTTHHGVSTYNGQALGSISEEVSTNKQLRDAYRQAYWQAAQQAMTNSNYYNQLKGNSTIHPIIDQQGKLVTFRAELDKKLREQLIKQSELGIETLGNLAGRVYEEDITNARNKKHIDILNKAYMQAINKTAYVNINGNVKPRSQSKADVLMAERLNEFYNSLPIETQKYIEKQGGLYVYTPEVDNILGHRFIDITNIYSGKTTLPEPVVSAIKSIINMFDVFGLNPVRAAKYAQQGLIEVVSYAKDMVLNRSVVVGVGNILSNVIHLVNLGVPINSIVRDSREGLINAEKYNKDSLKLIELNFKLNNFELSEKERTVLSAQIKMIENSLQTNPIALLAEGGIFSSISNANLYEKSFNPEKQFTLKHKLGEKLGTNSIVQQIENSSIGKTAMNILISPDSKAHDFMVKVLDYGDFVAKYVLYKNLTQNKGFKADNAMDIVREEFVNYSMNRGAVFDYLNATGITWFASYALGIQKIVYRLLRRNFLGTLATYTAGRAVKSVDPLNLIGVVPEQNVFDKNWLRVIDPTQLWNNIETHYLLRLLKAVL